MAIESDLVSFVRQHFRSVWAVEILLVLCRDRSRNWTVPALVAELRASTSLVEDNLQRLEVSGLVICDDDSAFRYAPASPLLDGLCEQLAFAYRERPVTITNTIARPTDSLQSLADAFKFKGEDR